MPAVATAVCCLLHSWWYVQQVVSWCGGSVAAWLRERDSTNKMIGCLFVVDEIYWSGTLCVELSTRQLCPAS